MDHFDYLAEAKEKFEEKQKMMSRYLVKKIREDWNDIVITPTLDKTKTIDEEIEEMKIENSSTESKNSF